MRKKLIQKINIFLMFMLYVILVIACFISNRYTSFNFFEKLFSAPFYELTVCFSKTMNVGIAFFLTFTIGIIILYPIFSSSFSQLKKMVNVWQKLIVVSKWQVNTEEEQIRKTQQMLEIYEKDGISLLNIFKLIFCSLLGFFLLKAIFGGIFRSSLFENADWKLLWFDLDSKDSYFVLPTLCFILIAFIPVIKSLIKIKQSQTEFEKANIVVCIFMTIAGACLLAYPIINSSIFSIFILFTNLIAIVKNFKKDCFSF